MDTNDVRDLEFRVKFLERTVEQQERRLDAMERHLRGPFPRPFFRDGEESVDGE